MRSYSTPPRWLVREDSQVNKMLGWMRHLPDEWEWTWMLPLQPRWQDSSYEWLHARATHIDWAPNVLTDRFGFPMNDVLEVIEAGEYDIAIVEAIEHVAGFKAAQKFAGKEFPVVGMIGLYDDRDDAFYLRQIEGAAASDLLVFPLQVIAERWYERAKAMVKHTSCEARAVVVPAIFDPQEVLSHTITPIHSTCPRIFFISRISDDARTKASLFIEAVCQLRDEGVEFEVWLANPTGVDVPISNTGTDLVGPIDSREEYINRLWNADIVPVLYSLEDGYSVGACEAIATDNLLVTPDGHPGVPVDEMTVAGMKRSLQFAMLAVKGNLHHNTIAEQKEWLATNRSVASHIGDLQQQLERLVS